VDVARLEGFGAGKEVGWRVGGCCFLWWERGLVWRLCGLGGRRFWLGRRGDGGRFEDGSGMGGGGGAGLR